MSTDATAGGQRNGRDLVVFLVWQSLPYVPRVALSFLLILGGLAVQVYTESLWYGLAPIALGNLLLLVRGYDNRVDLKRFSPGAEWEKVDRKKLDQVIELDKNIRRWDRSLIDITNVWGALLFVLAVAGLVTAAILLTGIGRILAIDAMVLLLPHWVTGVRSVLRLPQVVVRAEAISKVLDGGAEMIGDDKVEILVLFKGKEVLLPEDVKFRISFPGQDEGFLGLYGQVVINNVQGRSYPYFYVVMVARKDYGLREAYKRLSPPGNIIKEIDDEDEVEFIVIRQETTRTSGYHTKPADAMAVFIAGYQFARDVAVRSGTAASG